MSQPDENAREIADQSRKIASSVIYSRLKGLVEASDRDTRGKAKVATWALIGFLVWIASGLVGGMYAAPVGGSIFLGGFLVYPAFVFWLIYKYLR